MGIVVGWGKRVADLETHFEIFDRKGRELGGYAAVYEISLHKARPGDEAYSRPELEGWTEKEALGAYAGPIRDGSSFGFRPNRGRTLYFRREDLEKAKAALPGLIEPIRKRAVKRYGPPKISETEARTAAGEAALDAFREGIAREENLEDLEKAIAADRRKCSYREAEEKAAVIRFVRLFLRENVGPIAALTLDDGETVELEPGETYLGGTGARVSTPGTQSNPSVGLRAEDLRIRAQEIANADAYRARVPLYPNVEAWEIHSVRGKLRLGVRYSWKDAQGKTRFATGDAAVPEDRTVTSRVARLVGFAATEAAYRELRGEKESPGFVDLALWPLAGDVVRLIDRDKDAAEKGLSLPGSWSVFIDAARKAFGEKALRGHSRRRGKLRVPIRKGPLCTCGRPALSDDKICRDCRETELENAEKAQGT